MSEHRRHTQSLRRILNQTLLNKIDAEGAHLSELERYHGNLLLHDVLLEDLDTGDFLDVECSRQENVEDHAIAPRVHFVVVGLIQADLRCVVEHLSSRACDLLIWLKNFGSAEVGDAGDG